MIAVVTAGGCVDDAFAALIGTPMKALAPWRNGALIDVAITAARAAGASKVIVVGGPQVAAHCAESVDDVLPASDDGAANLATALGAASPELPLLLLTSDLPFITGDAIRRFLAAAQSAELAMPIASAAAYVTRYVGAPNHITKLGSERVANGSIFYFASGQVADRSLSVARRLFRSRKSLFGMAQLLGVGLLARFCLRTLTIDHIEAYAKQRFGLDAHAVRDCDPALCYDIDTPVDYRFAQEHDRDA